MVLFVCASFGNESRGDEIVRADETADETDRGVKPVNSLIDGGGEILVGDLGELNINNICQAHGDSGVDAINDDQAPATGARRAGVVERVERVIAESMFGILAP